MAYFANNPIIASVTAGTFPSDDTDESTNKRIVLSVTINGNVYKFKHAAESGESYDIDISSAYRAELARLDMPTPSSPSPSTNTVTGTYTVIGECVYKGVITEVSCSASGGNVTARRGGYSEVERMSGTSEAPSILSTKPTSSPEVVKIGSTIQLGSTTVKAIAGSQTSAASNRTYFGESNNYRHTMYFLNRYGEIESASILTLEALSVGINSTTIEQVRAPQYASYAKKRNYHTGGTNTWKMSSGYLEREWLQWFAHDFLMAEYYWLDTQQGIIPVLVTTDESIDIYDKTTGELKAVNFKIESALEGVIEL